MMTGAKQLSLLKRVSKKIFYLNICLGELGSESRQCCVRVGQLNGWSPLIITLSMTIRTQKFSLWMSPLPTAVGTWSWLMHFMKLKWINYVIETEQPMEIIRIRMEYLTES